MALIKSLSQPQHRVPPVQSNSHPFSSPSPLPSSFSSIKQQNEKQTKKKSIQHTPARGSAAAGSKANQVHPTRPNEAAAPVSPLTSNSNVSAADYRTADNISIPPIVISVPFSIIMYYTMLYYTIYSNKCCK